MIKKIIKRDGSVVDFDAQKIFNAIARAAAATNEDSSRTGIIKDEVVAELESKFGQLKPSVEDIQDLIEKTLIKNGKFETAKAYIIYRQARADIRDAKEIIGIKDNLKLSVNSIRILSERYLKRNDAGKVIESPDEMFRRIARAVAEPDANYGENPAETEEQFYRIMKNFEFLPNSPTLMNAGTRLGQLAACFVLPVEDSLPGIFDTLKHAALIHQSGGGTGFSFTRLRPKGDVVKSTMGVASGPVSFMKIFDRATEIIKQGGRRRGANMGILRVDHPDIVEFIQVKDSEGELQNFNISVAITDDFIGRVEANQVFNLINPRTGKPAKSMNARDTFEMMVASAWKSGDPGMIFIDEINRKNPTPGLGKIESTNPCGEVPLLPYESCNLGSINLARMFTDGKFDYRKLENIVRIAVHFLDNIIDANNYPLPEIDRVTKGNRKIGLGVMGFADCLIRINIPYDSDEALQFAGELMHFIAVEAKKASCALAGKRGSFPNIDQSVYRGEEVRNATMTSIAPTGTISTIADTASGIEPLFSVSYMRHAIDTTLVVVNPIFEEIARARGFYSSGMMAEIMAEGSIMKIKKIPDDVKRLFPIAHEIIPEFHIKMQAAFQQYVDNSVSKTINLPEDASMEQTRAAYLLAHKLRCKGVTIYRYGCKKTQALSFGAIDSVDIAEQRARCAGAGECDL